MLLVHCRNHRGSSGRRDNFEERETGNRSTENSKEKSRPNYRQLTIGDFVKTDVKRPMSSSTISFKSEYNIRNRWHNIDVHTQFKHKEQKYEQQDVVSVETNGCRSKVFTTKHRNQSDITDVELPDSLDNKSDKTFTEVLRSSMQCNNGNRNSEIKKVTMGFPFLKNLIGQDPSYIVMELTKRKPVLLGCISRTAREKDFLEVFLNVVAEAYMSTTTPRQIISLYETLKESRFFDTVGLFLIDLISTIDENVKEIDTIKHIFDSLLTILLSQLQRNPSSFSVFARIVTMLNQVAEELCKAESIEEAIWDKFLQLKEVKKIFESNIRKESKQVSPPDDFREYPVIPGREELLRRGRPFLRKNVVDGHYENLDHYLDVQYRLLREDFVGSLREGLLDFIDSKDNKHTKADRKPQKLNKDIKIYENITVLSPVVTESGLCYKLNIAMTPKFKRIRWGQGKRLTFGSLICLTDKEMKEFYIATVVERDSISAGTLTIRFEEEFVTIRDVLSRTFNMAESSAYFEAYKYVLSGMQVLQDGDLPFVDQILGKHVKASRPAYLSATERYDLRPLVDTECEVRPDCRLRHIADIVPEREIFTTTSSFAKSVCVCDLDSWPSNEKLNLDESQYKAVQGALTKEFVIVQGPPGTGKTYIGLQIVKVLLQNKTIWAGIGKTVQPMLIVCYTNHALDQFLEGIIKFFKGDVLRIGGRSNSKYLEGNHIKVYRKIRYGPKSPIGIMQRNKEQANKALEEMMNVISDISKSIEIYRCEIIHERVLKSVMGSHYSSLVNGFPNRNTRSRCLSFSCIFRWLGLSQMVKNCWVEAANISDRNKDKDESNIGNYENERKHRTAVDEDRFTYRLNPEIVNIIRNRDIAFHAHSDKPASFRNKEDRKKDKLYRSLLRSQLVQSISNGEIMSEQEACTIRNVWRMDNQKKWKLYRLWVQTFCMGKYAQIDAMKPEFEELSERFQEAKMQIDKEIMKQVSIIGMTTSGAARYQAVLKEVGPKIVIVEEAAEVLEAHIAMSLSKSCQHLILIGDHKQLRPNPNVYSLAKNYHLDISLFERMVKLGRDYSTLNLQHRMRPQISSIVRHIYPDLQDHESVEEYPNVKGVCANVQLINHIERESRDGDGNSYSNHHEAEYAKSLCKYLLLQGYGSHQITVLTTYTAQLFYMRRIMSEDDFQGVEITVVDNYQGEENDIIILSLVRSNDDGRIGFLKTENRICVALSRAKIGFYILGNFSHLSVNSQLWRIITDDMKDQDLLKDGLKLYCQNHPKKDIIEATKPSDFANAPEGGCMLICDARLECGHKCERYCHILDPDHKKYECLKPCTKQCEAGGHPCKAKCFRLCPPCPELVTKVVPSCSHEQEMKCSMPPNRFICQMPCEVSLKCGHPCTNVCGKSHTSKCPVVIEHTFTCGHTEEVPCWRATKNDCPHPCNAILMCEHLCNSTCGACLNGRIHRPCRRKCERTLVCGHKCSSFCDLCLPCKEDCRNRCIHSRCQLKCGEPCKPCKEPCSWKCEHFECTKLCYEVCDRPTCSAPCRKKINRCNHQCIGLCGEPCPELCRICNKEEVTTLFFGTEDDPNARFVLLEDCNHIVESTAMDRYMNMTDDEGTIKLKCCPKCSTPIQKSCRYGTIVNETLSSIELVKVAMRGDTSIDSIGDSMKMYKYNIFARSYLNPHHQTIANMCEAIKQSLLISECQIVTLKNQQRLCEAFLEINNKIEGQSRLSPFSMTKLMERHAKIIQLILEPTDWLSEQQIEDFTLELKRSRLIVKFADILVKVKKAKKEDQGSIPLNHIKKLLLRKGRFVEEKEKRVHAYLKELIELTNVSGLGITDEERMEIVKAVGLTKGHWYKCPNNHVYAIGECGGASEHGKCPECKADIGGECHRLADGNTVAGEMDGAKYAAYSEEANNMMNFDLDNLH
ncbi:NFX1-type zinc finger-containing protein 1 [Mactra antiquata]